MYRFKIEIELPNGREAEFVFEPPLIQWDRFDDDNDSYLCQVFGEARSWLARDEPSVTTAAKRPGEAGNPNASNPPNTSEVSGV